MFRLETYAGDFQPTRGTVIVATTAPTLIVPLDVTRSNLFIGNFSGSTILLSTFNAIDSTGSEIILKGTGDTLRLSWVIDGYLATAPWYGLSLNVAAQIWWMAVSWRPPASFE